MGGIETDDQSTTSRSSGACVLAPLPRRDGSVIQRVEALYYDYAQAIDEEVERWPDLFTEDARYRVTSRENYDRKLPLAPIYCEGRGMILDRAMAVRQTTVYATRFMRHAITNVRITESQTVPSQPEQTSRSTKPSKDTITPSSRRPLHRHDRPIGRHTALPRQALHPRQQRRDRLADLPRLAFFAEGFVAPGGVVVALLGGRGGAFDFADAVVAVELLEVGAAPLARVRARGVVGERRRAASWKVVEQFHAPCRPVRRAAWGRARCARPVPCILDRRGASSVPPQIVSTGPGTSRQTMRSCSRVCAELSHTRSAPPSRT